MTVLIKIIVMTMKIEDNEDNNGDDDNDDDALIFLEI